MKQYALALSFFARKARGVADVYAMVAALDECKTDQLKLGAGGTRIRVCVASCWVQSRTGARELPAAVAYARVLCAVGACCLPVVYVALAQA